MPNYLKYLIPFFILTLVISYAYYSKKSLETISANSELSESSVTVLKELPKFSVHTLAGTIVNSENLKKDASAYFVHIWGTWCGPCETEFPEILNFAERIKDKKVKFYLVAVNDEVIKIEKFLKRFKTIPDNVTILIDQNNTVMDKFGTYKVPETFLFGSDDLNKNKYVGPQTWTQELYLTQLNQILGK